MQKTTQKHVQNVNNFLLKTFKTTTDLSNNLKKERKVVENKYLESVRKQKQYRDVPLLTKNKPTKEDEERRQKQEMENEVKNIEYFVKMKVSEKNVEMIQEQKHKRRDNHYAILKEYEVWLKALTQSSEENYREIKLDVETFFIESDLDIKRYLDEYTHDYLKTLEITFISEMTDYLNDKETAREGRSTNLLDKLNFIEDERERSLNALLDRLEKMLIDNAFFDTKIVQDKVTGEKEVIVVPDVKKDIIAPEAIKFKEMVAAKRKENEIYLETVINNQRETFKTYRARAIVIEKEWRKLKHDESLALFMTEMEKREYNNPEDRNALYAEFKIVQQRVFEQRKIVFYDMDNVPVETVTKAMFEKYVENLKGIHEKANEAYDHMTESLVAQHRDLKNKLTTIREGLRQQLVFYSADLPDDESIEKIIDRDCQPLIDKIVDNNQKILSDVIKVIEENDTRAHEFLMNLAQFYLKFGALNDDLDKRQKQEDNNYKIAAAKLEDDNDEKIEEQNGELEKRKKNLRQALHHIKLDQCLEIAFQQLDVIEAEYRKLHTDNEELAASHPGRILSFYEEIEGKTAELFKLVPESRREEFEKKYREDAEHRAKLQFEEEIKKKEEEELKAQEEKKGGKGSKPPPPKKVDPKKQAKDLEDRMIEIMKTIYIRQIEEFQSPFDRTWIHTMSFPELVREFYKINPDEEELKKQEEERLKAEEEAKRLEEERKKEELRLAEEAKKNPKGKKDVKPPVKDHAHLKTEEEAKQKELEQQQHPPKPDPYFENWSITSPVDLDGNKLLDETVLFAYEGTQNVIKLFMKKFFGYLNVRMEDYMSEWKQIDEEFIDMSMEKLDKRLKTHYPLKGKLETEIYQVRSAEITEHKRLYERHVRDVLGKMDKQTDKFNVMLEEAQEELKNYDDDQKRLREALVTGDSLSKMQGLYAQAKESSLKIEKYIIELKEKLQNLSDKKLKKFLAKNADFIKSLVLFEKGGKFDQEEIDWYQSLLVEVDEKFKNQAKLRGEKAKVIIERMLTHRKNHMAQFEKEYAEALETLSAKDGTGKKYGKPKRIAQEKLRLEMTKCEKAQETINNLITTLDVKYKEFKQKVSIDNYILKEPPLSIEIREILMTLRTCMARYAQHIEGLKPDSKVGEMPRVSYKEERLNMLLEPTETEADAKRKDDELAQLGPLYYQKDAKKFREQIDEIEKVVKEEAQKIYQQMNKVNLLTGNDKIPDHLRNYLEGVRKQTDEFRLSCVRQLRDAAGLLSDLSEKISEMLLESIKSRYMKNSIITNKDINFHFDKLSAKMEQDKNDHAFKLRPNLSNPSCEQEFKEITAKEKERLTTFLDVIEKTRENLLRTNEDIATRFFKCLLNNFNFLLEYYDRMLLFEDFIKLPGDEDLQKKHSNLRTLLKTKQFGIVVDRSTERCLEKTWPGFPGDSFSVVMHLPKPKETPEEIAKREEAAKGKAKAPDNKATKKDPKGKEQPVVVMELIPGENTRDIKSFKTFRQKSANSFRNSSYKEFKGYFDHTIADVLLKYQAARDNEIKFQFSWEKSIYDIFNKS